MMVYILSIVGSSHPSRHGQGSKQGATSRSRVGQSRQMNTRDTTTTVVATVVAAHRQHSATMAAMTPPSVVPEAMLEAAQQLIHNPPGPHASPSAVE
jgi:hypothetical protein